MTMVWSFVSFEIGSINVSFEIGSINVSFDVIFGSGFSRGSRLVIA